MHLLREASWRHIWKLMDHSSLRDHLKTHSGEKLNKCKQCVYACSDTSSLKKHFKIHSGEKSNKCNQCDYASAYAHHLRTHLKTHNREKSNKCNQCDFASSQTSDLGDTWKYAGEKSQTNATNVTLLLQRQVWSMISGPSTGREAHLYAPVYSIYSRAQPLYSIPRPRRGLPVR